MFPWLAWSRHGASLLFFDVRPANGHGVYRHSGATAAGSSRAASAKAPRLPNNQRVTIIGGVVADADVILVPLSASEKRVIVSQGDPTSHVGTRAFAGRQVRGVHVGSLARECHLAAGSSENQRRKMTI